MVVMPAFAHADQPGIVSLRRGAIEDPALFALSMREMADQPMAGHTDADPDADTPDQPTRAADDEKQDDPRQLLPHPCSLDKGIKAVIGEPRFKTKFWRVLEHKLAM